MRHSRSTLMPQVSLRCLNSASEASTEAFTIRCLGPNRALKGVDQQHRLTFVLEGSKHKPAGTVLASWSSSGRLLLLVGTMFSLLMALDAMVGLDMLIRASIPSVNLHHVFGEPRFLFRNRV